MRPSLLGSTSTFQGFALVGEVNNSRFLHGVFLVHTIFTSIIFKSVCDCSCFPIR